MSFNAQLKTIIDEPSLRKQAKEQKTEVKMKLSILELSMEQEIGFYYIDVDF